MTMHPAVKKALLLLTTLVLAATGVTATTAAISSGGMNSPDALLKVQPPPPQQGGTCLSGTIIDRYYQPAGAGWTVQITSSDGQTQSQPADAAGHFRFEEMTAGDWQVALDIPDGWQAFTPAAFPITLSGEGSNCASVRFQVESLACLVASKLEAIPGAEPGELPGIAGWGITATLDTQVVSGTTDEQGSVQFANLQPGSWTVSEETRSGWLPAEGYTDEQIIDLVSPADPAACQQLTFANQQWREGCVSVMKTDPLGSPIEGWEMTLYQESDLPVLSGLTDASGVVTFTELTSGEWIVREGEKDWWRPTGSQEQSVSVENSGSCVRVTFTNQPLGCVDGYQTGPAGEPLGDWTVTATNPDSGEVFTTTTDADGYYSFPGLTLGTWVLEEDLLAGWEATSTAEQEILVNQPFTCQRADFQNQPQYACVDVYKTDSSDGAGLAGWEISIKPSDDGLTIADITDGTGWVRFDELAPGSYIISERPQEGWQAVTPISTTLQLDATGTCGLVRFENQPEVPSPQLEAAPEAGSKKKAEQHGCRAQYRVRAGDTLFRIAKRHETNLARLIRLNRIANPNLIYTGQVICLP